MTPRLTDPYETLGVARGATAAQIKAAHRRLAKRFHPDRGSADARGFLAVQEAYKLLSDPARRQEWDAQYAPAPASHPPEAAPRRPARAGRRPAASAEPTAAPIKSTLDFDVYDRSSGAAWSSAARAYFRRGDHELPGRGSFHHVGAMPLTAARARAAAAAGNSDGAFRPAAGVVQRAYRRPPKRGVIGRLLARLRRQR